MKKTKNKSRKKKSPQAAKNDALAAQGQLAALAARRPSRSWAPVALRHKRPTAVGPAGEPNKRPTVVGPREPPELEVVNLTNHCDETILFMRFISVCRCRQMLQNE